MDCPIGDDILIRHTSKGVSDIPVSYHQCDTCQSHWIDAFDANYVSPNDLPQSINQTKIPERLLCPTCREELLRAHEKAMAPNVLAYYCTTGHGYFFLTGNLRTFRQAQVARISYHKLWDIPIPPLRTVLLASLVLLTGLASGFIVQSIQTPQRSTIMAKSVINYHDAIVSPRDSSVTFLARTTSITKLTLGIPSVNLNKPMETKDGYTHNLRVPDLPTGTHTYLFIYQVNRKTIQSKEFTLTIR